MNIRPRLTLGGEEQLTTGSALPAALCERVQELGALTGDQLVGLLDHLGDWMPVASRPTSLTLPGPGWRGDSLNFQPVASICPRIIRFIAEQEFEGVVIAVDPVERIFIARLFDLTAQGPAEEAEIAFDEISPDDHALIVPGGLFNWVIGRITEARSTKTSGQVKRISEIRFRRFYHFSPDTMARAERHAATMFIHEALAAK